MRSVVISSEFAKRLHLTKIFGMFLDAPVIRIRKCFSHSIFLCAMDIFFFWKKKPYRFCQLALWGAAVKPSSKDTSCKFIGNQLASTLTGLTSSIGSQLTGTLGKLKVGDPNASKGVPVDESIKAHKKPTDKQSASSKHGGVLGIF